MQKYGPLLPVRLSMANPLLSLPVYIADVIDDDNKNLSFCFFLLRFRGRVGATFLDLQYALLFAFRRCPIWVVKSKSINWMEVCPSIGGYVWLPSMSPDKYVRPHRSVQKGGGVVRWCRFCMFCTLFCISLTINPHVFLKVFALASCCLLVLALFRSTTKHKNKQSI